MNFFTKQLYEQMQIWNFLMNFTNQEEDEEVSEDIIEYYQKQGKDYYTEQKRCYEHSYNETKPLLLKYLPESLRVAIYDEFSVYGKMPNNTLMTEIDKYRSFLYDLIFNESEINVNRIYNKYYKDIKSSLPTNIQNLNEQYSFHDSQIISVDYNSKKQIVIKLSCKGSCLPSDGIAVLTFYDVKFTELNDDYIGNWWLWDETHLSDLGKFDFQAIFHKYNSNNEHSLNELRIVADEVSLSFLDWKDSI